MGNFFATVKMDKDWKEKTGLKWPDERPLDEVLVAKAGMDDNVVREVLRKLEKQNVTKIGALLAMYYDKEGGEEKMQTHGLDEASAATLMRFFQKVKEERANGT